MLSTAYRLRLESICQCIANKEEVPLEDMIISHDLSGLFSSGLSSDILSGLLSGLSALVLSFSPYLASWIVWAGLILSGCLVSRLGFSKLAWSGIFLHCLLLSCLVLFCPVSCLLLSHLVLSCLSRLVLSCGLSGLVTLLVFWGPLGQLLGTLWAPFGTC